MTLVGCSDQLLVVFEFLTVCGAVNLFSRLTFLLIGAGQSVACADFRESSVRMMHVLDDIFAGHGGQNLDFGARSGFTTERGAGAGMVALGITGTGDTMSCGDVSCVMDGMGRDLGWLYDERT